MRVAFFGTPAPAVPFLVSLLEDGHTVPVVVTRPDRPAGRSREPRPTPVKVAALERGLEVIQPRTARGRRLPERLRAFDLDALVVVAYGNILPRSVLESARHGAINVHFSLLPKYRGAAPVQWALAMGESETGVCTMRLDEGMDTGDVLGRTVVRIEPGEHAPALQERLVATGVALLRVTLGDLSRGVVDARPQDASVASYAPILERRDGHVSADLTASEVEGRVRGFDPWPGVWMSCRGRRVRLVSARAVPDARAHERSGTVLGIDDDEIRVACGAGTVLAVDRLQFEGRRPVSAREALNGRQVAPGDVLERVE